MKKNIVGTFLVLLGIAAVALCMGMQSRFRDMARDQATEPGKSPLGEAAVKVTIPQFPQSPGASDPAALARRVSTRIYGIGAVGGLFAVAGIVTFLSGGHNRGNGNDHS